MFQSLHGSSTTKLWQAYPVSKQHCPGMRSAEYRMINDQEHSGTPIKTFQRGLGNTSDEAYHRVDEATRQHGVDPRSLNHCTNIKHIAPTAMTCSSILVK